MALHSRDRRVAGQIQQLLASVIGQELNDPRVPRIFTITDVTVAKDLRTARVYYSQLPDDEKALDRTESLLQDSMGFLRSRVAEEINLRVTPELHFTYDPSAKNYQRINTLLHGGNPDADQPATPEKPRKKRRG
ncbi:30S ribosome-binding factor RbfA [Candidatus Sumerlaeota bacterium]|nr:30S ribosome-binding factor RbfA [Candidatus Sumerlaeota bacterium]